MGVTLDDDVRQFLVAFEDETGVTGQDCLVAPAASNEPADERLVIVVSSEQMSDAIGPGGETVKRYEETIGRPVRIVEDADDPATFVANTLAPAAVHNVTISENGDTVAYVEVAPNDRGVAIGTDGQTIEAARALAARHFGIDDVQLI